jgi:hypothetical protein
LTSLLPVLAGLAPAPAQANGRDLGGTVVPALACISTGIDAAREFQFSQTGGYVMGRPTSFTPALSSMGREPPR